MMRLNPPLTYERANELFRYDPHTGVLCWRVTLPGKRAGAIAGTLHSDGYIQIQADGDFYRAHRIAWLLQTGEWPQHHIDHRNGIRSENRWRNLREATPLQNARNRRPGRRNKSGTVGVCLEADSGKWSAYIGVDNRTVHLGSHPTKEHATQARKEAERLYFGEFAPSLVPSLDTMLEGAI